MVTRRQLASGVGAGTLGIGAAEAIQKAEERRVITAKQGAILASGIGLGSLAVSFTGVSTDAAVAAAGFGGTELGWYFGREIGTLPRLTFELPEEVNVADQFISSAVFGLATAAGATVFALLR